MFFCKNYIKKYIIICFNCLDTTSRAVILYVKFFQDQCVTLYRSPLRSDVLVYIGVHNFGARIPKSFIHT